MRVALERLTKRFGTVTAVQEMDLEVRSGEFVALLGWELLRHRRGK